MNNKRFPGYLVAGVIILVGIYSTVTYNALVKKEEKVKLQVNEVQNAYQRRIDFIPNVVNIVKGQAGFEQSTLQQIAEARSKATSTVVSGNELTAEKYRQQAQAQDELAGATNRLVLTIEKYPALQGAAAFAGLQTQLEGTERRIKIARKDFNAAIADYNSKVKSFPTKIVAAVFGFKPKEGFQSDSGSDQSTEIKFK